MNEQRVWTDDELDEIRGLLVERWSIVRLKNHYRCGQPAMKRAVDQIESSDVCMDCARANITTSQADQVWRVKDEVWALVTAPRDRRKLLCITHMDMRLRRMRDGVGLRRRDLFPCAGTTDFLMVEVEWLREAFSHSAAAEDDLAAAAV